ncbi:MAG: flippase-like domain-containing protein [Chloroflexi bacterium]|nr:flippase-like domain-containing protein [Chloroflexota bacterium]
MANKRVIARSIRWLLPLLISGLVIWLVLRTIDFQAFLFHLGKIRWQTLVYATIVYFASYTLRVFCWYLLLRQKVTFREAFFTMGVGYLLNNIFPFRLGEIGRTVMLDDSGRISPFEVLSSVVMERIFDVFLAALFIIGVFPRVFSSGYDQSLILVTFFLATIGLVVLFLLAKYRHQIAAWLTQRGARSQFLREWLIPKISLTLEGFSVLTDLKTFLLAFGSLMLSWWLAFGQNFLIFSSISKQPPFWWMVFVLSAGAFGAALPSAPAGLGVFEGVMVASFAVLGVSAEIAFTHAIVTHAMSILYASLIGLVGLRRRGEALFTFVQRVLKRSPRARGVE